MWQKFTFACACIKMKEQRTYRRFKFRTSKSWQFWLSPPVWRPPEASPLLQAALSTPEPDMTKIKGWTPGVWFWARTDITSFDSMNISALSLTHATNNPTPYTFYGLLNPLKHSGNCFNIKELYFDRNVYLWVLYNVCSVLCRHRSCNGWPLAQGILPNVGMVSKTGKTYSWRPTLILGCTAEDGNGEFKLK